MIKRPIYAFISFVLLVVVVGYSMERWRFLKRAEHTVGKVVRVTSSNGRCGSKSKYACTRFDAEVEFIAKNEFKFSLMVSAGNTRGHDQPASYSRLQLDSQVPVVYDPKNPNNAYEDTVWGVWGGPIMVFIFQLSSFFTSLIEPRRRREV